MLLFKLGYICLNQDIVNHYSNVPRYLPQKVLFAVDTLDYKY